MPNLKASIYWDSCVFLDRLKRHPQRIDVLEAITDAADAGDLLIVTSSITIAEVARLPDIDLTTDQQATTINAFFEHPWISVRFVDEVIAKEAQRLKRIEGVSTCDAVHLATALRYRIPVMHTYDGLMTDGTIAAKPKLLAFDKLLGDDPKLRIEPPSDPRPQPSPELPEEPGLFPERDGGRILEI
jgi:predicted nucleic acid-binding protein